MQIKLSIKYCIMHEPTYSKEDKEKLENIAMAWIAYKKAHSIIP